MSGDDRQNSPSISRQNRPSATPCILNPEIEAQIKTDIADIVVKLGMSAIADYDKQYVESIVDAIETFAG